MIAPLKNFVTLCALLLLTFNLNAQSTFQFQWDSINNTYYGCASDAFIFSETVIINNTTNVNQYYGFEYEIVNQVGPIEPYVILFGNTDMPGFIDSFELNNFPFIPGPQAQNQFNMTARPNNAAGEMTVHFTVYNLNDLNDRKTAVFIFIADPCTGLEEQQAAALSAVYSNGDLLLTCPVSDGAVISIFDLSGKRVGSSFEDFTAGIPLAHDVSFLDAGLYIINVRTLSQQEYQVKVLIP